MDTKSNIKRLYRCATAILLLFGAAFTSLALELPVKNIGGRECYYYTIQQGDEIYTLSQKWGIPRAKIIEFNPTASDGIKPGMTLYFPVKEFAGAPFVAHSVEPVKESVDQAGDEVEITAEIEVQPAQTPLKIAICMPFLLSEENPGKASTYATDFYRGFLLGVDSLRGYYGNPELLITAIDTKGEMGFLNSSKADMEAVRSADIVVAPETAVTIDELGKTGKSAATYVLNVFQARDSTYLDNPYMLQGNIPAARMYSKAADALIGNLRGAKPIILENERGKSDKQSFVEVFMSKLAAKGIDYEIVKYDGTLTASDLAERLPGDNGNYVFVPSSGAHSEFQKYASALCSFKNQLETAETGRGTLKLFGYPEFTRFNGDSFDKLKTLNTSYYSRFYHDPEAPSVRSVEASYINRYGTPLPDGVPNQALFGFDVARWLIALATEGEISLGSIEAARPEGHAQSSFRFVPVAGGGLVNDALYIITLSDSGNVNIELL